MLGKCRRENTLLKRGVIPRKNRDQQGDGHDVERDDTPCHITHSRWDAARWIGRLPRRESDDLRPLEVDEDNDHRECYGTVPIWGKAPAAKQDARPDVAVPTDETKADQECSHTERHECRDLDEGEPELTLAKFIDTKQIEDGDDEAKEHRPPDRPNLWEKTVHDDTGGNHLRGNVGDPRHPI